MCEEFSHAFFIGEHFEVHVYLEVAGVLIAIWAFQNHAQVIYGAEVALAHIDHYTWILSLTESDFTIFIFGFNLQTRLSNQQLLLIHIASDLDDCARRCLIHSIANRTFYSTNSTILLINYYLSLHTFTVLKRVESITLCLAVGSSFFDEPWLYAKLAVIFMVV